LNVPDPKLFEQISDALGTSPSLVEKDWYVVQALKAIAETDLAPAVLIFTGGTCLSKAWKLIQRFSEDVDFKAAVPANYSRAQRRQLRAAMIAALQAAGFGLLKETAGDEGRFFLLQLEYGSSFPRQVGLRPHIQLEVSMRQPKREAILRPITSFAAEARRMTPEIEGILCADPVETAAEKISALSWRVLSFANQAGDANDPSLIRHLHDLAALETQVIDAKGFGALAQEVLTLDAARGSKNRPMEAGDQLSAMLTELANPYWRQHYETFIHAMSYATADEVISFDQAFAACQRLAVSVGNAPR
jgi:hypothetical protein